MTTTKKRKSKPRRKSKKAARPSGLQGYTYKLSNVPNGFDEVVNLYVTINNNENGEPFEIFLNCSDQYLYEMLTALMVTISKSLQNGVPVQEIADELKQIHSVRTGHYIPGRGIYCNSVVARIGYVLEEHYINS